MTSREIELKAILNSTEFGSPEWEAASAELHNLRVTQAEQPVELGDDWCTSDGPWWN